MAKVLGSLLDMPDEQFRDLVSMEAKGQTQGGAAMLLRAPNVAVRWYETLGSIIRDINDQLAVRNAQFEADYLEASLASEKRQVEREYQRWRASVLRVRQSLERRRTEAAKTAKAQKRLVHEDLVQQEVDGYRNVMRDMWHFLQDDEAFVYAAWPRRFELLEEVEEALGEKGMKHAKQRST